MSDIVFPFWAVYRILDGRLLLAEALGFPEAARLGSERARVQRHLDRNIARLIRQTPLGALYRRHAAATPAVASVRVELEPPPGSILWRQPLPLHFPVLRWAHDSHADLALVPTLDLVVIANRLAEVEERLVPEIRAALARTDLSLSLPRLVQLQRCTRIRIEQRRVRVALSSARSRALAEERHKQKQPSVLAKVATSLLHLPPEPVYGRDALVEQLASLLTGRNPRSVLLVGPSGVGKTALVRELVAQRELHNLGSTPFWATSGARLVAGMSGYGMWQERCQQVVREASRRRAILHLGNLVELMEVGKSEHNNVGLAAYLRPSLARGDLLAVAECTPEQIPIIERENPQLLDAFHRLTVPEPDEALGRDILRRYALQAPVPIRCTLPEDTLDTLDRLHRRYATYSVYPGRPLRFLHNLLQDQGKAATLLPAHVLEAFMRETGLPRVLLDPEARLDLEQTRRWFGERVVGQVEAIDLVVDLLATTKAGLTRPRKPIASLLFIGPTGVGKTEMAKALAEFLFDSRQRLTRFDMSEYGDPVSVQRLVGGVFGSEGLLTAKVREQPFSVLLLDEFEKAHPQFLDLLLQVLGEGRLTDAAGRLADFCNTVVIMTSNLGAESFQQGVFGFGEGTRAGAERREEARAHFVRAVQAAVRPELFNRIDRLVPFAPLDAATIERIAGRHLERLAGRDGIRYRGVTLDYGPGVVEYLARHGFDARYGARPLLRTVERELLAPLADQMNRYSAEVALSATVRLAGQGLEVQARPRTDASGRVIAAGTAETPLLEAAAQCVELRRLVQALERSPCVRELHNELFRLEREQRRFEQAQQRQAARQARLAQAPEEVRQRYAAREVRVSSSDQQRMAALARLRALSQRLRDLAGSGCALEDEALQALYAGLGVETLTPADLTEAARPLREAWYDLLLTFYCRQFPAPDRLTLALFAEDPDWLLELTAALVAVARERQTGCVLVAYRLPPGGKAAAKEAPKPAPEEQLLEDLFGKEKRFWRDDSLIEPATVRTPEKVLLVREKVEDERSFLAAPSPRLLGIGLDLRGRAAAPRFTPEAGLHLLRSSRTPQPLRCLVEVSEAELVRYLPPEGITRRGAIGTDNRRRTYDRGLEVLDDVLLSAKVPWQNRPLAAALGEAIEVRLRQNLLALIEE